MRLNSNQSVTGTILYLLLASTIALQQDEEDELLDEVIPHKLSKRVYAPTKRQFIEAGYGGKEGDQLMQMPQESAQPFMGASEQMPGPIEQLPGANEQMPGATEQLPGATEQLPGTESQLPALTQTTDQAQSFGFQKSNPVEQGFGQNVVEQTPDAVVSQSESAQQYSQGSTQVTDPTQNYNPNSVTELNIADNGFKVTTDAKEKANHLASDVKNFGLWEYSVDNTAASTDQTAKILQNKLLEDDSLYKGKDSASINVNQLANAQGTKVDQLLDIFNKATFQNQENKIDSIEADTKGLEAYDSATKGYAAIESNGKNVASSPNYDDNSVNTQDSAQVLNSEPDVSVVTLPNTYKLEDEHGNSLDSVNTAVKPSHAAERFNMVQILKALLKKKIQAQAARLMLKQNAAHSNKGLKPFMTSLQEASSTLSKLHGSEATNLSDGEESKGKEGVSKTELKLLQFIKNMLKGTGKQPGHKEIGEGEIKAFMGALTEMGKANGKADVDSKEAKEQQETTEKAPSKPKETKDSTEGNSQVLELSAGGTGDHTKAKDEEKQKQATKEDEKETKAREKSEQLKTGNTEGKVNAIKAILRQMKPTTRTSHESFYLDPEEPLGNSPTGNSNTLMNYLEHETALVDQFQEGSQIGDPTKQLKHIAQLLLDVARNAKNKDTVVDARRTTVSPKQDKGTEKSKSNIKEAEVKDDNSTTKGNDKNNDERAENKKEKDEQENKGQDKDMKEDKTETKESKSDKEQMDVKMEGHKGTEKLSQKNNEKTKEFSKVDHNTTSVEDGNENKIVNNNDDNDKKQTDQSKVVSKEEKIKDNAKLPEVEKARNNDKIVELNGKVKEQSDVMKANEDNSNEKDNKNTENVKPMAKLEELNKLRHNKKIISKIDSNNEKETPTLNDQKSESKGSGKPRIDESKSSYSAEAAKNGDDEDVHKLQDKPHERLESGTTSKSADKNDETLTSQGKGNEKDGGAVVSKHVNGEQEGQGMKQKATANELTERVRPSQHLSPQHEIHQTFISPKKENENDEKDKSHLTPQLPFLNPGKAHLDVLENDLSLKQYLLEKGKEKILNRLQGSKHYVGSTDQSESESFDNDSASTGKLLQLKDVTGATKAKIAKKPQRQTPTSSSTKAFSRRRPHFVSLVGRQQPLGSKLQGVHAIRPMPRLLLSKYKSMLSHTLGNRQLGALRHIAPSDKNPNSDASIRFAAIAKLISMVRERQHLIDVTASKKSLPDSKKPIGPSMIDIRTTQRNNSASLTKPLITSFYGSPLRGNGVIVPTGARKATSLFTQQDSVDEATAVEQSRLLPGVHSAMNDASVDPSDVTRSQLEKPKQPSINQVMDLLGGRSKGNQISKKNTTESSQQSPNTLKSTKGELAIMKQINAHKTTNINSTLKDANKSSIASDGTSMKLFKNKEIDDKSSEVPAQKPRIIIPIHDQKAATAIAIKPDTNNLLRSLKSDINTANFLLRKRSRIPKVKRRKLNSHHRPEIYD